MYIKTDFFNITTAPITLHANPIPGTNLLSQSSYFSPVQILTSIKLSVCPKLTNTAHCFIQWRQSINKAQLLSLSALLHFQITVNYVGAGAMCQRQGLRSVLDSLCSSNVGDEAGERFSHHFQGCTKPLLAKKKKK